MDGTKVKANASRHKAMSYEYMKKEEERLSKEIAELLAKAKSVDEAEDALHGPHKRGDELPQELARRETRLARIYEPQASACADPRGLKPSARPGPGRGSTSRYQR